MKKILIMALLAISGSTLAQHDIYVYTSDLYTPVLQAKSIQRIEFGETGIQVVTSDGETQTTSYDSFDYFRFYPTPIPTGVVAPEAKSGQQNSIYSLTGVKQETRDNLPAGIYIMKVNENGQKSIKKILKK